MTMMMIFRHPCQFSVGHLAPCWSPHRSPHVPMFRLLREAWGAKHGMVRWDSGGPAQSQQCQDLFGRKSKKCRTRVVLNLNCCVIFASVPPHVMDSSSTTSSCLFWHHTSTHHLILQFTTRFQRSSLTRVRRCFSVWIVIFCWPSYPDFKAKMIMMARAR